MEQRITAIETQEKRSNRRSIFVNGKFALGVDETVVADLGLHVGQQISEDELKNIVHAELATKAKERALRLLEYRPRSKAEIARRLNMAGFAEDIIEETLTRLEDIGFLNDEQFARSWVGHRLTGKAMGKTRIKWELRQKGVEASVVEEALSEVDSDTEYASAMEAARRRWERDRSDDERAKPRSVASFLRRQGFDWDTITKVLNELGSGEE